VLKSAVLAGAVVLAVGALARAGDSPPPQPTEVEVITQGVSAEFKPARCGGYFHALAGRVVRRSSAGDLVPIPEAAFSYVGRDGAGIPLSMAVAPDGGFEAPVVVMGGQYKLSSLNVELAPNARRGRLQLVVSAPGCISKQITFGAEWEARDVVLRCRDSK